MARTAKNKTKNTTKITKKNDITTKQRTKGKQESQPLINPSSSFPTNLLRDDEKKRNDSTAYNDTDKLEIGTLCPGAVFFSRQFMDPSECLAWINHVETCIGFEYISHPATRFVAHRECGRIQRTDWNMAQRLYERMGFIIEQVAKDVSPPIDTSGRYGPVGCNGNIRIYKYEKGMSFGKHVDGSDVIRQFENGRTEITVLVYLSSCGGGATRFYPVRRTKKGRKDNSDGVAFNPEAGAILLHVHGDRCLEHEADPVDHGIKYVLRTDIVYGCLPANREMNCTT